MARAGGCTLLVQGAVSAKDRRGTVLFKSHVELAQSTNVRGELLLIC